MITGELQKFVKRNGWEIIPTSDLKLIHKGSIELNGILTIVNSYKPTKSFRLELENYFIDKDYSVTITATKVQVEKIKAYELNGQTFAFVITYIPYFISKSKDVPGIFVGAIFTRYFYDEDGDGKFESRYQSIMMPIFLPEWVTRK